MYYDGQVFYESGDTNFWTRKSVTFWWKSVIHYKENWKESYKSAKSSENAREMRKKIWVAKNAKNANF